MSTPVVMPQMGESIAEGTIVRWIKKVGDTVDRDEPLFEISTDKVDAEIPSPAAGVLIAIRSRKARRSRSTASSPRLARRAKRCLQAHQVHRCTGASSARVPTGANGAKSEKADATGTPGADASPRRAPARRPTNASTA